MNCLIKGNQVSAGRGFWRYFVRSRVLVERNTKATCALYSFTFKDIKFKISL
ncbi:MAG TPA: hypothetical protein V6D15_11190 [Oculatellaceae cyanobacterium]